ncbi:hypothetical protein BDZ91DRAFT_789250 [Kalaharituber pfeilii]|nr:hypothetical protein BDZ91DRAFT_789250 [Kalaharituber pfeilii]
MNPNTTTPSGEQLQQVSHTPNRIMEVILDTESIIKSFHHAYTTSPAYSPPSPLFRGASSTAESETLSRKRFQIIECSNSSQYTIATTVDFPKQEYSLIPNCPDKQMVKLAFEGPSGYGPKPTHRAEHLQGPFTTANFLLPEAYDPAKPHIERLEGHFIVTFMPRMMPDDTTPIAQLHDTPYQQYNDITHSRSVTLSPTIGPAKHTIDQPEATATICHVDSVDLTVPRLGMAKGRPSLATTHRAARTNTHGSTSKPKLSASLTSATAQISENAKPGRSQEHELSRASYPRPYEDLGSESELPAQERKSNYRRAGNWRYDERMWTPGLPASYNMAANCGVRQSRGESETKSHGHKTKLKAGDSGKQRKWAFRDCSGSTPASAYKKKRGVMNTES